MALASILNNKNAQKTLKTLTVVIAMRGDLWEGPRPNGGVGRPHPHHLEVWAEAEGEDGVWLQREEE